MIKREIPRNPGISELNDEAITFLTKLCFRKDDPPVPVDLLFVFSTPIFVQETADVVLSILKAGLTKQVFITGGIPEYADSRTIAKPEYALVLDHIMQEEFPDVTFFTEDRSRNTLENVEEALRVYDFRSTPSLLFLFKSHAAGRGYLILRRFLPDTAIFQRTLPMQYEGTDRPLTRENWHEFAYGRERVWGEYLRIQEYGKRGDIAYEEVRKSVERIGELVGAH